MRMHHIESRITMINNDDGVATSEAEEIQNTTIEFYKKLFGQRKVSYAGRVVLINSVLFGASNYRAQCVFLPKEVCASIEKMIRAFLWSGTKSKFKAKVSWENVCKGKKEGGLGIKSLHD
ncbi:hypothetical protein LIER_08970 [Lithospermum erythrorhizon]|uniref:Uncharacterized protein n=1 Tax=Lithospermum erythrorhizon TaxID=34254 RepID=A0AAV3PGU8_LITER